MVTIIIYGITHSRAFIRRFLMKKRVTEWECVERYSADFNISGSRVKLVCEYSMNKIILWFEKGAFSSVLKELLKLDEYISKALLVGRIPLEIDMEREAFIELPGAKFEIAKVAHGIWVGRDNRDVVFSATIEGLAELLDLLEGGA